MKLTLFYLKTGGGHLSTAKSIAAELQHQYADGVESLLIDCLEESPRIFRTFIEEGYTISANQLPFLWKTVYFLSKAKPVIEVENAYFTLWVRKYIKKRIIEDKPDKIIILHHLLIKPVLDVLEDEQLKIPTLIVATDPFTPPNIWFAKNHGKFVVFSEKAKLAAMKRGVPEENITIFPIVINKKFSKKLAPAQITLLKKQHGFTPSKKLILIAGGGEGLRQGGIILKELLKANLNAEIAVVCGKNKLLRRTCEKIQAQYPEKNLKIYGFVDFMYELMNIADAIITKGGPATIMEILLLKKPPVISSYIWAQEKGNVEFVVNNKLGYYEPNPKKIPEKVKLLLSNKRILRTFQQNINHINILKNGSEEIAKYIFDYSEFIDTDKSNLSEIIAKLKELPKKSLKKIMR